MHVARLKSWRIPPSAYGRALWAAMVGAHAPALIGSWQKLVLSGFELDQVGACLGLSLATLFFLLKLIAWPPLRLPKDRHGFVAFWLIVALLHVDCFRPTSEETSPTRWAIVATVGVLISGPERISRAVRALVDRLESHWRDALPHTGLHGRVWLDAFRPHCWALLLRVAIPRSPPPS